MTKRSIMLLLIFLVPSVLFAQLSTKTLKVIKITEYSDGYLIKAVSDALQDTLSIVSPRYPVKRKYLYQKIKIGSEYVFRIEDVVHEMAQYPANGLVLRIKKTVIWKDGDNIKKIPYYSRNTRGLYIKKMD